MDSIDKRILIALDSNCRLSYQSLADDIGITATAIRKRFEKLTETGVIESFDVVLKPKMVGSDYLIALIATDGHEDEGNFIHSIGSNVHVVQVGQIVTHTGRVYLVHCEYLEAENLQKLGMLFRKIENVTRIELHTILRDCGSEIELKSMHLRILKCLIENARMHISEISERTGLTSRRVSRLLQDMLESNAFWFATRWNLSLGGNSEFYLKILYDEQTSSREDIDAWLAENYELEYWYSYYSALEPVLFAKFVTDHFSKAEEIARRAKSVPFFKTVDVLLAYPVVKFPRLGRLEIEKRVLAGNI